MHIPTEDAVSTRLDQPRTSILKRDFLVMKPLITWLRDIAPEFASGELLDFGCGNKPYSAFFSARVKNYTGADVSQNKYQSVDVIIPQNGVLPLKDSSIDTVLSTQVLEHVPDTERYLRETSRVLKNGGIFILTCPASYMLHEEPHDYYRFTRYGIAHLLQKHDIEIIRMDAAGGVWRLMGQTFINHKTFGRKFRIPLLSGIIYYVWMISSNVFFSVLDNLNTNEKDTLNYMVIARKTSK